MIVDSFGVLISKVIKSIVIDDTITVGAIKCLLCNSVANNTLTNVIFYFRIHRIPKGSIMYYLYVFGCYTLQRHNHN